MPTTWKPNSKIMAAGGIGVPLALIIQWALAQAGVNMPIEVATALGGLISTAVGYFVPETRA